MMESKNYYEYSIAYLHKEISRETKRRNLIVGGYVSLASAFLVSSALCFSSAKSPSMTSVHKEAASDCLGDTAHQLAVEAAPDGYYKDLGSVTVTVDREKMLECFPDQVAKVNRGADSEYFNKLALSVSLAGLAFLSLVPARQKYIRSGKRLAKLDSEVTVNENQLIYHKETTELYKFLKVPDLGRR